MAFISEIDYAGAGEAAADEFVEVTLMPGEDAADFALSFYDQDGTLHTGASSFFAAGEFTLQDIIDLAGGVPGTVTSGVGGLDLQVLVHPDNPAATIFIIPSSITANTSPGGAEAIALTDTSTGTVIDAYDPAGATAATFTEGAASGATPTATGSAGGSRSLGFDYLGNETRGATTVGDSVICFCSGTNIETMAGPKPVEDLRSGDIVLTESGAYLPLRFVIEQKISKSASLDNFYLHPVCIKKGALGGGLPKRDLFVSRQHRIMARSKIAARMFGQDCVLIAAHVLAELPGIEITPPETGFSYWHLIFDRHAIILAEGAPAESLLFGSQTRDLIPEHAREVILRRFPEFQNPQDLATSARYIPSLKRQRRLIQRHIGNKRDILCLETGEKLKINPNTCVAR